MAIPQFAGKAWSQRSCIEPDMYRAYAVARGSAPTVPLPPTMLMLFSKSLVRDVTNGPLVWDEVADDTYVLGDAPAAKVGVVLSGIGAPAAAVCLEELLAYGAKRVIAVGTAGTLLSTLPPGHVVVCQKAVRDEGTSHHYWMPTFWAKPDKELTQRVGGIIDRAGLAMHYGASWTTDAPYRETVDEALHYLRQDVHVVEMEAAALMTVAWYRRAPFAEVLVVSDRLNPDRPMLGWQPAFHDSAVRCAKLVVVNALVHYFERS